MVMNEDSKKTGRTGGLSVCSAKRQSLFACIIAVSSLAPLAPIVSNADSPRAQIYVYSGKIEFDLKRVPFSRFGSYLGISDMTDFQTPYGVQGVYLRTMHLGGRRAFELQLIRNTKPIHFTESATPTLLTLSSEWGSVEICFQGPDRLRMRGTGVQLRLVAEDAWAVQFPDQRWEINTEAMKYMLRSLNGRIDETVETSESGKRSPVVTFGATEQPDDFEAELDAYTTAWQPHDSDGNFDDARRSEDVVYRSWLHAMPRVETEFGKGAELAAYVNWESVVSPSGNLKRPAMLMSKNWMTSIWSWDQAFNAMSLSLSNPKLALDQFLLPFDTQDAKGDLPDKWDADSIAWEYSKPPIHGWALLWMIHHGALQDRRTLSDVYESLDHWTEWYFRFRDVNGNGLPEYRHGNESGWDNSTVFKDDGLIETPDLSAYLVVQMEALSEIAKVLGKLNDSQEWKKRSTLLLHRLVKRFWTGHEFSAFRDLDGREVRSKSLLLCMPIILGDRLPVSVRTQLVKDLKMRAEQSPYGIPSEPPDSSFYQADGYWRGPIWGPTTMIVAEGLDSIGERQFANELRRKFCLMAQKSGMSENFDALTGAALRDPAYTWTSSVFLVFAHQLAKQ